MEEDSDFSFPADLVKRMAALELMGIPVPRKWGGAGADFIAYIAAIHEIAKVSAAVGVILSVHTSVGTLPIVYYGTEEQRNEQARKLAAGQWLGAFALTEPHAGSDAASIRTRAVKDGDEYLLNGTKMFITNAGAADLYITFAVTDPSRGPGGITAFLLERGVQGFIVGKKEKKMGLHGSNTCELRFEDVRIPASQRLGEEGQGFAIAKGSLDGGRIGIAAQSLGIAEAALQLIQSAICPTLPNRARSTPLIRSVHHRHKSISAEMAELAELTAQVEAARLLVYRAAFLRQEGLPCTKESSTAKLFASDTAVEVAGAAVRLLGMKGYTKASPAERLFRDAKVTQIYEGTNEIHRIVIGNQLLR